MGLMIHKLLMFVLKRYNLQFSITGISLITHSCPREKVKSLMLFAELFISVPSFRNLNNRTRGADTADTRYDSGAGSGHDLEPRARHQHGD